MREYISNETTETSPLVIRALNIIYLFFVIKILFIKEYPLEII